MGSALGGMLGDFGIREVGDQEKYLRIAGFYVLLALTQCRFAYWVEGWLAERVRPVCDFPIA
jgi:hypothetical protein